MAATILQKASVLIGRNAGVAPAVSFTDPVTAGSDILVAIFGNDNAVNTIAIASVADGGDTFASVISKQEGGFGVGSQIAAIYRAKDVAGGTPTITVTFSGTFNNGQFAILGFAAYEVSGLDQTTNDDATNSNGAASGSPIDPGSVTPSIVGDLIVVSGSSTSSDGNAPNVGSGFTLDFSEFVADSPAAVNNAFGVQSQINAGTSAVPCAFGSLPASTQGWAAAAAAFKPAPPPTFSISGNAGVAGATVALTGTASASTTADSSGNYSFTGLVNGSYTVTPSLKGYKFKPASLAETISGGNITGANFTAKKNAFGRSK